MIVRFEFLWIGFWLLDSFMHCGHQARIINAEDFNDGFPFAKFLRRNP